MNSDSHACAAARSRLFLLLLLLPTVACGPGEVAPRFDGGQPPCENDSECSDELFCTGTELCDRGNHAADARGCLPAPEPACAADRWCDETADLCGTSDCAELDTDGDGHDATACGGDDCDDGDANRFPHNFETCDDDSLDEDCDGDTFGARDADSDGFVDATCCNGTGDHVVCGDDCGDSLNTASPGYWSEEGP